MTKIPFPAALLAVIVVAGGVGWGVSRIAGGSTPARSHRRTDRTASHAKRSRLPHGWSVIAVARGPKLTLLQAPGTHRVRAVLSNPNASHAPLTLLVKKRRGQWFETYLPIRPNGALAWVPGSSVRLLSTAWSLVVRLRTHRLLVGVGLRTVRTIPIGVGTSVTPTPTGRYFITELLKQPDPRGLYGPYAFGLSAHSGVLSHFGRGGDGQIGIHGTNQPQLVGQNVSHGCIRLRNQDILWLVKRLPLGTPVSITHA